jgi:hypothetical protein
MAAMGYLGRYVAGTCIGDTRILSDSGTDITISVKNYREEGRRDTLTLTGIEFVRRFTLHILPRGFRRIRYAGLLCQRRRAEHLARCRELLKDRYPQPAEPAVIECEESADRVAVREAGESPVADPCAPARPRCCPRCLGTRFEFVECFRPEMQRRVPPATSHATRGPP